MSDHVYVARDGFKETPIPYERGFNLEVGFAATSI